MEQLLTLLITLIGQADKVSSLIKTARSEGRDVSDAEVDALFAELESARSGALQAVQDARQ